MRLLKDGQCVRVCLKGISVEWSASSGTCLNLLRSPNVISSVFDREKKKNCVFQQKKEKKKADQEMNLFLVGQLSQGGRTF